MNKMVFGEISVTVPFQVEEVLSLTLQEEFGEHAKLMMSLLISDKEYSTALQEISEKYIINVLYRDAVLFCGMITDSTITQRNGDYTVDITIEDYSILLDIKKKKRSFQCIGTSYAEIIKSVFKEYEGKIFVRPCENTSLQKPVIQYEETDWQFIKRLASVLGLRVMVTAQDSEPVIYVEDYQSKVYENNTFNYHVMKDFKAFYHFRENEGACSEEDYLRYRIVCDDWYGLGDKLNFKNQEWQIIKKTGRLKEGTFEFTYELGRKEGIHVNRLYAEAIAGVSIYGTVIEIVEDKVKLHLEIDEKQNPEEAYAYPFATPYAAYGNTGWYAMPEVGERVRLYIPDRDEQLAYADQASRLDGAENGYAQNPKDHYLGIPDETILEVTPDSIQFKVEPYDLYISFRDSEGITIISPEDIWIQGGDSIKISASTIEATAKNKIVLSNPSTSIIVDSIVHIQG